VLAQGALEKVAPESPVSVGQELELKLGEVGLHDAHAGVAKVDGVDIYVGGAAKLVGKKVKVRITLISEGVAWAELLSPVEHAAEPLTAEAEAEKPTRARRPTRTKEPAAAAEPRGKAEPEPEPEVEDGEAEEIDAADGEVATVAAKKRTRRGTRGGRNRKKKTATTAAAGTASEDADGAGAVEAEAVPEAEAGEAPPAAEPAPDEDAPVGGPVIHVPDRSLGAENGDEPGAAPRKRTRRGTRGGRNRKKKTAATAGTAATVVEAVEEETTAEAPVEPAADANGDGDGDAEWGYTPMAEWGLDGE